MPRMQTDEKEAKVPDNTIEVTADSLDEARKRVQSQIPEGLDMLSETVLSDGSPRKAIGSADTVNAAFEQAARKIPSGAHIGEKEQMIVPTETIVVIEAFDEKNATEQASVGLSYSATISGVALRRRARRAFLELENLLTFTRSKYISLLSLKSLLKNRRKSGRR